MMKKVLRNIFFLFVASVTQQSYAQTDSIPYGKDFVLKEGLYFSYFDFRKNNPFPKDSIVSKEDKSQLDFTSKVLADNKEITISFNGQKNKGEVKKLWGFSQNNTLYLNYDGKFYRVPVFGNISHFLGTVEVYNYSSNYGMYGGMGMGMGGMGGYGGQPMKSRETRQFIFDFYTGDIMDYTLQNVEILISRDLKLYEEFMLMKKRKRKDMMMLYVRKYNAAHPINFPVGK